MFQPFSKLGSSFSILFDQSQKRFAILFCHHGQRTFIQLNQILEFSSFWELSSSKCRLWTCAQCPLSDLIIKVDAFHESWNKWSDQSINGFQWNIVPLLLARLEQFLFGLKVSSFKLFFIIDHTISIGLRTGESAGQFSNKGNKLPSFSLVYLELCGEVYRLGDLTSPGRFYKFYNGSWKPYNIGMIQ